MWNNNETLETLKCMLVLYKQFTITRAMKNEQIYASVFINKIKDKQKKKNAERILTTH